MSRFHPTKQNIFSLNKANIIKAARTNNSKANRILKGVELVIIKNNILLKKYSQDAMKRFKKTMVDLHQ